jgi:beta-lactamase regulating signal transducer with metallopeptidase domain
MLIRTLPIPKFTILIPRNALFLVSLVWLAGALLAGGYYFISNLLFVSSVKKNTVEETDEEILSVWEKMRERLEYKRPTRLLRGDVSTPFSMGQTKFTRCTVLPNRTYTKEELSMIFCHELYHLERCDVNTKVFLCLCNAICWFNPLVWVATKRAAEDLERSCDEIVTENMDEEERREYAGLLLTFAAPQRGFTTCLSAAAGTLRYRLKSVMEQKKRLLGTLLLSAVLFVSVICFGNVAISDESGTFKEMLSKYDATIGSIYDAEYSKIESWDAEALMDTLSKIELRHLAGPRDPGPKTPAMTFVLTDGHRIKVFDNTVFVNTHKNLEKDYECYLSKEKIDVDMIYEALNK